MFSKWFILIFLNVSVHAQKQLALVKNGKVVGSFPEGNYIRLIMKDGQKKEGHIIELMEFSMITSSDTVPFNKIKKVGIPKDRRKGLAPLVGSLLFLSGIAYVSLDQINRALGYNTQGGGEQVAKTSLILIATGGVLLFIRPRYQRVNMGTYLRTVDYRSKFYRNLE